MKWTMFIGHAVMFLSVGLMVVCALAFRLVHRSRARRSPLQGRKVGNLPGQQLLQRVDDHSHEVDTALTTMYMAFPLLFMVWLTLRVDWQAVAFGYGEAMFLAAAIAVFLWGLRGYVRHYRARDRARDGLLAERVTGMQLNRLIGHGCTVMHDLPGEGFNIDHVVVTPRGVYAVETKSFRKPKKTNTGESHRVAFDGAMLRFPDFAEKDAVEQARRQAQWLSKVLREALSRDVPVIPALALPGWLIDQSEETWRSAAVKVFTPMGGGANFMTKDIQAIDLVTRNLIRDALAVRYPDIPA